MEKVWGGKLKEGVDGEGKRLVLGRGFVKNLVLEKREKRKKRIKKERKKEKGGAGYY